MNYEEKMKFLSRIKPEYKDVILAKILRGERHVDITHDEDIFFQVNKDRVTLERFTNRNRFTEDAKQMAWDRQVLHDTKYGKTKSGKMRWLGDIPAEIYFSRPEFSPMLPREERAANIRKFLNKFPKFRAGDKQL